MNLGELQRLLRIAVDRDDLADLYISFVNRGMHDMQVDVNWNGMRSLQTVSIGNGEISASMPDNFKVVTKAKTPISVVHSDGTVSPCEVYSREELDRLTLSFGVLASATSGRDQKLSVSLDCQDGQWELSLPAPADENLTFRISYFGYLRNLVDQNDENILTTQYPDVILERAIMLAFRAVNDPEWKEHAEAYTVELQRAARIDSAITAAARKDRGN